MSDPVHNPLHYKSGGIEVIDVIEAFELGFHLGNVVKYVLRAGRKGDALEDLEKAAWYLDREIDKLEEQAEADGVDDDMTHAKSVACAETPNVGDGVEAEKRESLYVDITSMDDVARRMAKVFFDTPIPTTENAVVPQVASEKQEYDG